MTRLLPISGMLAVTMGVAWLAPATAAWLDYGSWGLRDFAVVSVGPVLILTGVLAFSFGFRELRLRLIPPPVRIVITGTGLFLSFCALEFSDGLLRQGGRVFYWTSLLFLPALALFYGQVLARRWAWWVARVAAGLFTAWFLGFLVGIPFAQLRGNGVTVPWSGRIYMAGVTLVFAGMSVYVFRSLGRNEARAFYGLPQRA